MQVCFLAATYVTAYRRLKPKVSIKVLPTLLELSFRLLGDARGISIRLPRCLSYTRNLALVSELAEADTADSVLTKVSVRSATDLASVVSASGELRLLLLLEYH